MNVPDNYKHLGTPEGFGYPHGIVVEKESEQ